MIASLKAQQQMVNSSMHLRVCPSSLCPPPILKIMPIRQLRKQRTLLVIVLVMFAIAGFVWSVVNLQRGIKSAYYEWGITCIIASYAEDHNGVPPRNWDDLVGYEYHTHYLPEPRTMQAAAQHVSVKFSALHAFHNGKASKLPIDVVKPIRGFEQHWIAPSTTLERYFRDGERPHGSFDGEYADQQRNHSTGRD
ncbi:MAG: hypothetical protein WBD31_20535 [Rubripirellula sp.]